jgi:uncharacterized membrane protein YvlD (DUF360 family)
VRDFPAAPSGELKIMENFWKTVSKYPIFVLGAILGVLLNATKPLVPLFKNPVTAIALIGAFSAGFAFIAFTLRSMLALQ